MSPFNPYSVGYWLTKRAQLTPDRIGVDFEDRAISYGQLNERANRAAGALTALGVGRGDRVAVISDNRPEYVEVFFACAKLGAIVVPVSWRLSEPEIQWQLDDSTPRVLITAPDWKRDSQNLEFGGSYEEALASASPNGPEDKSAFDDSLMILYTSGTTGRPKGATLTHGNFFWANINLLIAAEISADTVSLVFLPMFHIGGWNVNTLAVFLKGGTVVLERQFDPVRVNDLIAKKSVTLLMGVPATYLFMSQQPGFEQADFSSVRQMLVGGAPMPEALLQTYASRGIEIAQGYGLTESSPTSLLLSQDDAMRKLGSAGRPYFFTDTDLMDETGNVLQPPATGEIVARGPNVMRGYWDRDDATAETIRDGWLHTGDVGRTDEEGFFYIVDRKKDMIISGGENIYPAEVENALYEHPGIAEAAVIGIPDEKWGEKVHAIVVPKEGSALTEDDVVVHSKERLAKFKVPRSVEIRSDPLPRTPAGKVRKPELRAPFWEREEKQI
jgi:fatty-acyl-CoA synthase